MSKTVLILLTLSFLISSCSKTASVSSQAPTNVSPEGSVEIQPIELQSPDGFVFGGTSPNLVITNPASSIVDFGSIAQNSGMSSFTYVINNPSYGSALKGGTILSDFSGLSAPYSVKCYNAMSVLASEISCSSISLKKGALARIKISLDSTVQAGQITDQVIRINDLPLTIKGSITGPEIVNNVTIGTTSLDFSGIDPRVPSLTQIINVQSVSKLKAVSIVSPAIGAIGEQGFKVVSNTCLAPFKGSCQIGVAFDNDQAAYGSIVNDTMKIDNKDITLSASLIYPPVSKIIPVTGVSDVINLGTIYLTDAMPTVPNIQFKISSLSASYSETVSSVISDKAGLQVSESCTTMTKSVGCQVTASLAKASLTPGQFSASVKIQSNIGLSREALVIADIRAGRNLVACTLANANQAHAIAVSGNTTEGCIATACEINYNVINNSCAPIACTVTNSNILNSQSVSGNLVSGCSLVSCIPGFHPNGNVCDTDAIACTLTDALSNGVVVNHSNSSIQGQNVNGNKSACLLADNACNGGYVLSSDKKSCTAKVVACTVSDAQANGVVFTRSNNTVQGNVVALDSSACLLADNACDASSTLNANKKSCDIKQIAVTVNKLISTVQMSDITLGKIDCGFNCSSETKYYDYGSTITLQATPATGYVVSSVDGCDSYSGNNCTISNITSDKVITPVTELKALKLTYEYSNPSIATDVQNVSIFKNGTICSGNCLNTFVMNDIARITLITNSYIDVTAFNLTGSYSNVVTNVANQVSFKMDGASSVDVSIDLEYKTFTTQPTVAIFGASTEDHVITSTENSFNVNTSGTIIAREMLLSPSSDCSVGSYVAYSASKSYTITKLNQTSDFSVKYKNGTALSQCFSYTLVHDNILPVVTVNTALAINKANQSSYTISGTCSDNGQQVEIMIDGLDIENLPICNSNTYSKTLDLSSLEDQEALRIDVFHYDAAGNTGVTFINPLKDTVDPTLAINAMSIINGSNKLNYAISGSCSEDGRTVNFSIGSINSSATCNTTSWTKSLDVSSLPEGSGIAVLASISDLAGNNKNATSSVDKNTLTACTTANIPYSATVSGYVENSSCIALTCIPNYTVSNDDKSCLSASHACTMSEAQSNLWDVSNAATISGTVTGVNTSNCVVSSCLGSLIVDNTLMTCSNTQFSKYEGLAFISNTADWIGLKGTVELNDGSRILYGNFVTYNGVRYNSILKLKNDNTVDTTFHTNIGTGIPAFGFVTKILKDSGENLYIAGSFSTFNGIAARNIVKISKNGVVDTTYMTNYGTGFNGLVWDMDFDSNNNLYAVGAFTQYGATTWSACRYGRLNPNGSFDSAWQLANVEASSSNCGPTSVVYAVKVDSLDNIYLGGTIASFGYVKFNPSKVKYNIWINGVVRLTPSGAFDEQWAANYGAIQNPGTNATMGLCVAAGTSVCNSNVYALEVDNQNNLYVGGLFYAYSQTHPAPPVTYNASGIAKFSSEGIFDTNFSDNLNVVPGTSALGSGFYGTISFGVRSLKVNNAGNKLYVGGKFTTLVGQIQNGLARLNLNGTPDNDFNNLMNVNDGVKSSSTSGFGLGGGVKSIKELPNNQLQLTGDFSTYRGTNALYLTNIDLSTGIGSNQTMAMKGGAVRQYGASNVFSGIKDSSGNVYYTGTFTVFDGVPVPGIVKIDAQGNVNKQFISNLGVGFDVSPSKLLMDRSGNSIYMIGSFTNYKGLAVGRIAKFDLNGIFDTSFNANLGSGFDATINEIIQDSSGNLYIGGDFTKFNGIDNNANKIAKLSSSGVFNTAFSNALDIVSGTKTINSAFSSSGRVLAMAIDSTSTNIYVGGTFTSFKGTANNANRIAKLSVAGAFDVAFSNSLDVTSGTKATTSGLNSSVSSIAIDATNANIYIVGDFTSFKGTANNANRIAKLSVAGAFDVAFSNSLDVTSGTKATTSGFNMRPNVIVYSSTQSALYVGGDFTAFKSAVTNSSNRIAKLSLTGSLDTTFNNNMDVVAGTKTVDTSGFGLMGGLASSTVNSILLYSSDSVICTGSFQSYKGLPAQSHIVLNAAGVRKSNP